MHKTTSEIMLLNKPVWSVDVHWHISFQTLYENMYATFQETVYKELLLVVGLERKDCKIGSKTSKMKNDDNILLWSVIHIYTPYILFSWVKYVWIFQVFPVCSLLCWPLNGPWQCLTASCCPFQAPLRFLLPKIFSHSRSSFGIRSPSEVWRGQQAAVDMSLWTF